MSEEPLHERMEDYETLAGKAAESARRRDETAAEISDRLAEAITEAVEVEGANVEGVGQSDSGHRYRFRARLDRAGLIAALTEILPDGFVVSHVNDDGTLSIEWTGSDRTPSKRERGAILKAIIAEEMVLDSDGLIESVPTRERVLARAVELGIEEDEASARLSRLATLDVVDLAEGRVYPDENFSRY